MRFDRCLSRSFRLAVVALPLSLTVAQAASEGAEWGYQGESGPAHWGGLAEEFATCDQGMMQSPIDLVDAGAVGDLSLSVDYKSIPLKIRNNGKTVQVDFEPGSRLYSGHDEFGVLQVHFHTPSEHSIDGQRYPLTAHFVHTTAYARLGVLGVMYEPGERNAELQKIIDAAAAAGAEPTTIDDVTLDPNALLPDSMDVYRYMGSLTTPPCSEGVNWHVLAEPVEVGADQIAALEELMGMNARPVQPLNGRLLVAPEE